MMKLILAIIQDEDAHEVITALNDAKFQVTKKSITSVILSCRQLLTHFPPQKSIKSSAIHYGVYNVL